MITRLVRFELAGLFLHRGEDAVCYRLGDGKFVRARVRCIRGRGRSAGRFAFKFVEPMVHFLESRKNGGKVALAIFL